VSHSLSSGAGYAIAASAEISSLLNRVRTILTECDCKGACHKCLRHYRNQYVHGMLDRFAALELLNWGINGKMPAPLSPELQKEFILPLSNILNEEGCNITTNAEGIIATSRTTQKQVVVYPAMWDEPHREGFVFVSDGFIKFAKPYAVQKILRETSCKR